MRGSRMNQVASGPCLLNFTMASGNVAMVPLSSVYVKWQVAMWQVAMWQWCHCAVPVCAVPVLKLTQCIYTFWAQQERHGVLISSQIN